MALVLLLPELRRILRTCLHHSRTVPKVHELKLRHYQSLPEFDVPLHVFTKYGVTVRYDDVPPLAAEERLQFRRVVEDLRHHVLAMLNSRTEDCL